MCDASAFPHTRTQCTTHVRRSICGSGGPGVSRGDPGPRSAPVLVGHPCREPWKGARWPPPSRHWSDHAIPALPGPLPALEVTIQGQGLRPQRGKHACVHPLDKVVVDRTGWAKACARAGVPGGPSTQDIEDPLSDAPEVDRPRVPGLALPGGNHGGHALPEGLRQLPGRQVRRTACPIAVPGGMRALRGTSPLSCPRPYVDGRCGGRSRGTVRWYCRNFR